MQLTQYELGGARRYLRKAGICAATAAMAASLTCAPFAQAMTTTNFYGMNPSNEVGTDTVPSADNGDQAFDLTGGKIKTSDGKYYITGGCGGVGTASTDYLDVSGVSAIGTAGYNWGTKINESPNPFAWNDALNVFELPQIKDAEATSPSTGIGYVKSAWSGVMTYATLDTYRPDILAGNNASDTYATMVSMINQADGNSSYNPQVVNFAQQSNQGIGLTTLSDFLWATAAAVEKVQAQDSTKVTRYSDSAREIAQKFEGFLKGIQWYILSEVEGTSKMKTVAFVSGSSDGKVTAYAMDPTEEAADASTGSDRYLEGLEQTTNNVTAVNNGWTQEGEQSKSLYTYTTTDLATAFKDVDVVFYLASSGNQGGGGQGGGNSGSTTTNQTLDEFQTSLEAAGVKADVVSPSLAITNQGFGFARNYVELVSYVYPEYLKLSYGLYYFWQNFAHVKAEYIPAVMADQDGDKLLPTGNATTDLDTTGYSESYINEKIAQGEAYYQANYQNKNSNCSNFRLRATGTVPENEYQFGTFGTSTAKKSQAIKLSTSSVTIAKGKSKTVKVSGAKTALKVSSSNKKVVAKASGKTKVKITVKSGAKKGTYKVKVYAKATSTYKKSAIKTIKVKVK